MKTIIFTDLDGTLLDDKYSFRDALPALKLIKKRKIPLVFCTSKTEPETKVYLKKIGLNHPFIVENGGAIFIPINYFDFKLSYCKTKGNYYLIKLGKSYGSLKKEANKIEKETKSHIVDFSKINPSAVSRETGLTLHGARLAQKRKYTFQFKIRQGNINKIIKTIKKHGLNYTKGKIYHYIMGSNDKAKAVKILIRLYRQKYKKVITIGLGNNYNDLPMLKAVDKPFLVKNKCGYDEGIGKIKKLKKINFTASKGWNKAILDYLKKC